MIVFEGEQWGEEYIALKAGKPSASRFSEIFTNGGKPGTGKAYATELLAQRMTGKITGWGGNKWTDRGNEFEDEARAYYEFVTGYEVRQAGLCFTDDKTKVCSPDGMICESHGLEIKVKSDTVHVEMLEEGVLPTKHIAQVQGCMLVTGLKRWDFLAYSPDMQSLLVTVEADEDYHRGFEAAAEVFLKNLAEREAKLRGE